MTGPDRLRDCPALIAETDFDRPELHGFEVGMDGRLWVPSFPPRADDATGRTTIKEAA